VKPLNRKLIWPVLGLILLSFQAYAQEKAFDPSVLSAEGKAAYEILLKTELFAIGGIGYAGGLSEGQISLDILIGEDRVISALKGLVADAKPEGALYAFLGLQTLKCECFDAQLKIFNGRSFDTERKLRGEKIPLGAVNRMSGCMGFIEKVSDVLEQMISGRWDYWVKQRRVNRWSKEKGNR